MKFRPIFVRVAVLATTLLVAPALRAQQVSGLRLSAVLSTDTVRVGEPFTIGIIAVSADRVEAPPLLPSGEGWEQLEGVRVESSESESRFYYRLVAWQTDHVELPDLTLSVGAGGGQDYSVTLPAPVIQSVLPASEQAPLLHSPRPPIQPGFPWPLLLVALILLALTLWWLRHRAVPEAVASAAANEEQDVAARARAAVLALRSEAEVGSVAAAGFYDELEQILRHYLSGTRAWPAGQPVRESRELSSASMRGLHRQALLARFAALGLPGRRLVADADSSLDWLSEDEQ